MTTLPRTLADLKETVEGKRCMSNWLHLEQPQIDAFTEATGDDQWIHRAGAKEGGSLFGGPVAHGLLLLALAINLARDSGALPQATWVLYGCDKLRFRAPVFSGARIRCLTTTHGWQELGGRSLLNVRFTLEIEGSKIPALTTNCLLLRVDPLTYR
jgi:acyl dehydratase